jgi:hypothetical protein
MDCKKINMLKEEFEKKMELLKHFIIKVASQKPRKM